MFTLSDRAATEIAKAAELQEFSNLRISAVSGGCSGLNYSLNVELTKNDDDVEIDAKGVTVFVDPSSFSLLEGSVLEFSEEEGGFMFTNSCADSKGGSCNCGKNAH